MRLTLVLPLCTLLASTAALSVGDLCTGMAGVTGVCIPTSQCGGAYISGACPGTPDNVRCCTAGTCKGGAGRCSKVGDPSLPCAGTYESGHCPGPSNFKCCVRAATPPPSIPVGGLCTGEGGVVGVCIATSECTGGRYISGACPGTPDHIRCCTGSSCRGNGRCRKVGACTGGTMHTGACPGPSNYQCCVPNVVAPPVTPPKPKIDEEGAYRQAQCAAERVRIMQDALNKRLTVEHVLLMNAEFSSHASRARQCAAEAQKLNPDSSDAKRAQKDAQTAWDYSAAVQKLAGSIVKADRDLASRLEKDICKLPGIKCK